MAAVAHCDVCCHVFIVLLDGVVDVGHAFVIPCALVIDGSVLTVLSWVWACVCVLLVYL